MKKLQALLTEAIAGTALFMSLLIGVLVLRESVLTTEEQARFALSELTAKTALVIESKIQKAEHFTDQIIAAGLNDYDTNFHRGKADLLEEHETRIRGLIRDSVVAAEAKSGWFLMDPRKAGGVVFASFYRGKSGALQEAAPYDVIKTGVYKDEWFSGALEKGRLWTMPYYWPNWDANVITYSKRIEKDGEILGVAGTDLYEEELFEELDKIKIFTQGYIVLTDRDFNVIYHPTIDMESLRTYEKGKYAYLTSAIQSRVENSGIIETRKGKAREIVSYKMLTNGWFLVAFPNLDEAYAGQYRLMGAIVVASIIGILLSSIAAMFLGGKISEPFIKLNQELEEANRELKKNHAEVEAQKRALDFFANNDPLTGIPNRRAGMKYLEKALAEAVEGRTVLSIVFIDIDKLKPTNDVYGHSQGDRLIIHIIRSIAEVLREKDMLFRLGGDEFLVILPGRDQEAAAQLIRLVQKKMVQSSELPFPVSFSHGIEEYFGHATAPTSIEELIKSADKKMYHEKEKKNLFGS